MKQPDRGAAGARVEPAALQELLDSWPDQPQEAARKTIQRYGPPDEATPSRLLWFERGPWKRVVVNRDPIPHRFPKPHNDLLEGWIDYRVPPEQVGVLAAFDGSVRVERTRGELAARCDKEELNYLALNLAHDLVTGQTTVEEARRTYTQTAAGFLLGKSDPYTEGLQFQVPEGGTADLDDPTI